MCCTIPVRSNIDGTAPYFNLNRSVNLSCLQNNHQWNEANRTIDTDWCQ